MVNLNLTYVTGADGKKSLTIPEDRRALAVSYIQEGAAKSADEIAGTVQQGHDELCAALDGLSEEQARYKPSLDEWCVLDLMNHVVTTKRVVGGLSRSLAEGHWPPGIGAEWEEESAQDGVTLARFETLAEARAAADAAHGELLGIIASLDGPVDTEIRFKHFVFGALNCREWAVFQRIHDGNHTPQIAEIKASPDFPRG